MSNYAVIVQNDESPPGELVVGNTINETWFKKM